MTLAEGPLPLRAALMALGLLALLAPVHCSQGRPSWRYSSSEVVIPKKEVGRGKGLWLPGRLSYSLRFGGQRHVIHLWRKTLLWPRHLPVMTQDDQGALQMDYPYIPADCFYLGHLEEVPLSMVTIDTCRGGLEGIMKLDDLAYEIAPLKDSLTFEHTVSQIVADINATGPTYKLGHQEDVNALFPTKNFTEAPRISSKTYASHTAFIKGHSQIALPLYRVLRNVSESITFALRFFSLVDTFLRSLDFRYYVFLLTIYTVNYPVTHNDYRVPGGSFHTFYVRTFYNTLHPHTSTMLDQSGPHEGTWSPAVEGICGSNNLIYTSGLGRHYLLLTIINANQQGRLFGLNYDDLEGECVCQRRAVCIMAKFPQLTDVFSNCSFGKAIALHGNPRSTACYYETGRTYLNRTITVSRCGNGIVDEEEFCDCGSFKQCYADECCNTDCNYTVGSICSRGECCSKCAFAPRGLLCRPPINICDLPEYCNGSYTQCPEDFYLQNGTPCSEEGYCYSGNCTDRTIHCRQIFGSSARAAPEVCYTINTRPGFRFGHCVRSEMSIVYTSCAENDKMCGRLQCANVTQVPRLQEHSAFHQSLIEGHTCFGLDEHRGMGIADIGHVRDGTPCAQGLFCLNAQCNNAIDELEYDCTPQKCAFRGVCNNRKNCHCHRGWDPPLCLRKGAGGSVDSGPRPIIVRRTVKQRTEVVDYLRVIFGRIYGMIVVLLLGMATNVKIVKVVVLEENVNRK